MDKVKVFRRGIGMYGGFQSDRDAEKAINQFLSQPEVTDPKITQSGDAHGTTWTIFYQERK
jgi:hypothetical protein